MNENHLVNVLISTYNGECYIRDQIDSILHQTYPNICIYVRDDGSTDQTCSILREYEKNGKIKLVCGKNKGYGRSFGELLQAASAGDYWAFCDQDDIWLPHKIEWAVDWLDQIEENRPALYGCSFEMTNADMTQTLGYQRPPQYRFTFRRSLTDCLYQGFAMVFNRPLRSLMLLADMQQLTSHDWWAVILAERFGVHYFDPRIGARHRRLNESISGMNIKNRWKWLAATLKTGDSGIRSCAHLYVATFGEKFNDKEMQYAKWFASGKHRIRYAILKAFYPGRWRPSLSSEAVLRMLMLFGRV